MTDRPIAADGHATRSGPVRSWRISLLLIVGTIAAGLVVRLVPLGLPLPVMKYGGSILWALMVFWIVSAFLAERPASQKLLLALALAFAVEFFKLVHVPPIDAFRATTAGALLLGKYFSIQDLVAYTVAICAGAFIDEMACHPG